MALQAGLRGLDNVDHSVRKLTESGLLQRLLQGSLPVGRRVDLQQQRLQALVLQSQPDVGAVGCERGQGRAGVG